ncbi:hypothetical protein JCM15519_30620 [Fundidesulfovibrio butyratiphilus]
MPYMPNAAPQGVDPYAQSMPDTDGMPASLRRALEQAAARMVSGESGRDVQGPDADRLWAQAGSGARDLPGFETVVERLLADPRMVAHFSALQGELDDDRDDDLGPADFGPPPYDPLERMKWDVAHGVHKHLIAARRARMARKQARAQAKAQSMQYGNQNFLRALSQSDPLFERTYRLLVDSLRHQPPGVLARLIPEVDQDPRKFLELYGQMRQFVAMSAGQASSRGQAQGAEGFPDQEGFDPQGAGAHPFPDDFQGDPRAAVRRAVAGRMAAPSLENPGVMDDSAAPRGSRPAQLAALKARMNAQGAGPGDMERYLDLLGVADRMVR